MSTTDETSGETSGETAVEHAPETQQPERTARRFDRGLFLASLAIACGIVLIIWGLTVAVTGSDGIDRPDAIESVQPVENAVQVLQQERVVVDLEAGYGASLIIDGIELPTTVIGQADVDPDQQAAPGQQIDLPTSAVYDPGNAVISFQPVDGALIESFTQGRHSARVIFWPVEEPEKKLSYRWEFDVV
ncbi:MAG: hypothetical protein WBP59_10330 [Ilumatobacteraceae bacterium]